jgi:type II secretory pathway pseudopilin PulG
MLPRRGFSFVEIAFAVMILGIGFIMLAAIFPVAVQQTDATAAQSTAAAVAKEAVAHLTNAITEAGDLNQIVNPTSSQGYWEPLSTGDPFWSRIRGGLINSADPHFGWTVLYRVNEEARLLQLAVFVMHVQGNPYTADDLAEDVQGTNPNAPFYPATFLPKLCHVTFTPGGIDHVTFDTTQDPARPWDAVAPGAYLAVNGTASGHIYQVGSLVSGTTWELVPGQDLKIDPQNAPIGGSAIAAYIVGRGYRDATPGHRAQGYAGPAQDVAVYQSFFPLPKAQ